jgi:hypothetical protein
LQIGSIAILNYTSGIIFCHTRYIRVGQERPGNEWERHARSTWGNPGFEK